MMDNFNKTVAIIASTVIAGAIVWYTIKENERAQERHELGKQMHKFIYDKMVVQDMENNI